MRLPTKSIAGIAAALVLAASATANPVELHYSRAGDGYSAATFKPKLTPNPSMVVNIVTHPTRAALRNEARRMGAIDPDTLAAFSARTVSGSRCTIHVVEQSVKYEPEQVGHEALHCFYGEWHSEHYRPTHSRAGGV